MNMYASKTYSARPADIVPQWHLVDAENETLGRLAACLARYLKGKHKPCYTPHVDTGDYIVLINASKVAVTGNKARDKQYYRHTGYPGGIKQISFEQRITRRPEAVIRAAVKGMLPKNALGRAMLKKLKIYADAQHPHHAQQPVPIRITKSKYTQNKEGAE